MNDIGHSSIGFGHWLLLSSPLSGLSSVHEDPLKMSVAMYVVYLLIFCWFLEACSKLHLWSCFLASPVNDQLVSSASSHYLWRVMHPCSFHNFLVGNAVLPLFFRRMQRRWNTSMLRMLVVDFHVSHAGWAVDNTVDEYRRNLMVLLMKWLDQFGRSRWNTDAALTNLARVSTLV